MALSYQLAGAGEWLRGNLHTHTLRSDGCFSSDETINRYRKAGYEFLTLTDHMTFDAGGKHKGMVALSGIEYHFTDRDNGMMYHIVGIGQNQAIEFPDQPTAQEVIDLIRNAGGEAIIGHPYWLGLNFTHLQPLRDYLALEVWNGTCRRVGKPLSAVSWDELLQAGRFCPAVAVDDCHFENELFQGWIMARCEERSADAIMAALRAGLFYSTMGPEFIDIRLEDDALFVECSPVETINVISNKWYGRSFAAGDAPLTKVMWDLAAFGQLPKAMTYLRVELVDYTGKTAWSNPIKLQE
jgi:hypothetical protein